ncbi:MAG: Crp/Fnr family transcriptional regulator [Candidatus Competibacterales bacterium]
MDSISSSRRTLLEQVPIFGGLKPATLELLLRHSRSVVRESQGVFFHQGDPATSLFVVEEGEVAIVKTEGHNRYQLARLGVGACFGEMAAMDMEPRSASVVALVTTRALEVPLEALYELYRFDLKQFTVMQMNLGRELSRRLRRIDDYLFQLHVESQHGVGQGATRDG